MEQWKKNLYILWLGTFVAGGSYSLVAPFMPMLLKSVGTVENLEMWSGVAFASSFFVGAIVSPIWGAVGDKYGRKLMIIRAGFGLAIAYTGMAFATTAWHVVAMRLLSGLLSGFIPASMALCAATTPDEHMGTSLGLLQTGSAMGTVMGPLLGGLSSHFFGIKQTLIISACTYLVATAIVFLGVKEEHTVQKDAKINIINDIRIASTNRVLLIMFFTIMLFQVGAMILQPVLPIYIESLLPVGSDPSLPTGVIFSVYGIATVLGAPFWGRKGQLIGFKKILLIGLIGASLMSLAHVTTSNLWLFGGLRFGFGVFMAALMPSANTLIAKSVTSDFRGRAFGISTSVQRIGGAIGPMLGGAIGGWWGIRVVFVVTSLVLLVVAWGIKGQTLEERELGTIQEAVV